MSTDLIRNEAYTFLKEQSCATLITLNAEAKPEAAAVFFLIAEDFTCHFVTKIGTRKYKNLAERHIGTLFAYNDAKLISVEIKGELTIELNPIKALKIISTFQDIVKHQHSANWIPPIAQINAGNYVICVLKPDSVTYNNFSQNTEKQIFSQQITFKPQ